MFKKPTIIVCIPFLVIAVIEGSSFAEFTTNVVYSTASTRYLRDMVVSHLDDSSRPSTYMLIPRIVTPSSLAWLDHNNRVEGRLIVQPVSPIERFCFGSEMMIAPFTSEQSSNIPIFGFDESAISLNVSVSVFPPIDDDDSNDNNHVFRLPQHTLPRYLRLNFDPSYEYISLPYDVASAIGTVIARRTSYSVTHDFRSSLWKLSRCYGDLAVFDRAPALKFTIASSLVIVIRPRDYIRVERDSSCTILIESQLGQSVDHVGRFGQPILGNIGVLVDLDNHTIGFCDPI